MKDENPVAKPKMWGKRLLNVLLLVSVSIVALYFVGRVIWRFSGSNQWELVQAGNGAKVYSLKEPGSDLKQFKGIVRVRSTLAGVVAWLQDPNTCKDAGCHEPKTIEQVDDQLQYVSMQFNMPPPFHAREFVLRVHFHQIPHTKEIWVEYAAAADKTPPNACCFRVTNFNNTWRLTPLGNGEVQLEYTMNMDWGGFFPDLMSNIVRSKYMFMQLKELQGYLNREKYQNAKFEFIQEESTAGKERAYAPGVTGQ